MLGKGSKDMLYSVWDICAKPFPTTTEFTQEAQCRNVQAAPCLDLIVGITASPWKCLWGAHPSGVHLWPWQHPHRVNLWLEIFWKGKRISSLLGLTVFHLLGMSKDYGADYSKDHEGSSCSGVNKSLMVTSRNLIHLVIGRASHNRKKH